MSFYFLPFFLKDIFTGYWILSCQLLSFSLSLCSSTVFWFSSFFLVKSGVSLVAHPLNICLWFWQFSSNVPWYGFLCVFPPWNLKFLLNLWLDVIYQFKKFVATISLNFHFLHPLAPCFWASNNKYFGSFYCISYVLSFWFNLSICFSLDILYLPIFHFINAFFSSVQSVLKPTHYYLAIIFFSAEISSFFSFFSCEVKFCILSSILLCMLITVILKFISDFVYL